MSGHHFFLVKIYIKTSHAKGFSFKLNLKERSSLLKFNIGFLWGKLRIYANMPYSQNYWSDCILESFSVFLGVENYDIDIKIMYLALTVE